VAKGISQKSGEIESDLFPIFLYLLLLFLVGAEKKEIKEREMRSFLNSISKFRVCDEKGRERCKML